MKKFNFPTIGSILIFFLYWIVIRFSFKVPNLNADCFRLFQDQYDNKVGLPVFLMLLLASLFTMYSYRNQIRNRWMDYLLISPVLIHIIFFFVNSIRNLFL